MFLSLFLFTIHVLIKIFPTQSHFGDGRCSKVSGNRQCYSPTVEHCTFLRFPRSTIYINDIECEVALQHDIKTGVACQVTLTRESDSIKLGRMRIQLAQTVEEMRELMRALKEELEDEEDAEVRLKEEKALRDELKLQC